MKNIIIPLLTMTLFCNGCSSQKVSEMGYLMDIEAALPDDEQCAEETIEVLKKRIGTVSARRKFQFENTRTECAAQFKTRFSAEAVEMLLTMKGEIGFYELYTGDKLSEIAALIYEAAGRDSTDNPGMQYMLIRPQIISSSMPLLFQVHEDNIGIVMKYLEGRRDMLPKDARIIRTMMPEKMLGKDALYYSIYVLRPDRDNRPAIDQSSIRKASLEWNRKFEYSYVDLEFDAEGALKFERLTEKNIGLPLAIVMDGEVVSAPMVQNRIESGKCNITENFTVETLAIWAKILETGPLKLPVSVQKIQ